MTAELNSKKKDSSSFLAANQQGKVMDSLFARALTTSFSLLLKEFSFLCYAGTCMWLTMAADLKPQFSADPKQDHFCWRNNWQSICFRPTSPSFVLLSFSALPLIPSKQSLLFSCNGLKISLSSLFKIRTNRVKWHFSKYGLWSCYIKIF